MTDGHYTLVTLQDSGHEQNRSKSVSVSTHCINHTTHIYDRLHDRLGAYLVCPLAQVKNDTEVKNVRRLR
jgi:hypothetical protein